MLLNRYIRQALLFILTILILLPLISCAAGPPDAPELSQLPETPSPAISETPPMASMSAYETALRDALNPTPVPSGRYIRSPYLVKLEPYMDGLYTDGLNTFDFKDDGTVVCNVSYHGAFTLEKKDVEESPIDPKFYEPDKLEAAIEKADEKLFELYSYTTGHVSADNIVYADNDAYYFYIDHTGGGGSGESYYHADEAFFIRVTADEAVYYGKIRAVHVIWHDGYFYYVELIDRVLGTPGTGKVMRMDMDGSNKKTIVRDPVYGPFRIVNGRLYYMDRDDGKSYSVDLDGGDKTPVGERIAPYRYRVWLDFYDDIIISKFWNSPGFIYGTFAFPDDYASPAIMDLKGNYLLTFPAELCGEDAYEVVNWGYNEKNADTDYSSVSCDYLFLRSKLDGSYWVYSKHHDDFNDPLYRYFR